jgi:hypothetical protein
MAHEIGLDANRAATRRRQPDDRFSTTLYTIGLGKKPAVCSRSRDATNSNRQSAIAANYYCCCLKIRKVKK